jgi:hypothetical protein
MEGGREGGRERGRERGEREEGREGGSTFKVILSHQAGKWVEDI